MSKEPEKSERSQESDGQSAGKPETGIPGTGTPGAGAAGAPKSDPPKSGTSKSDPPKSGTSNSGTSNSGTSKAGTSKAGTSKTDAAGTDETAVTVDGAGPEPGDEPGEETAPERSRAALAMDALEQVSRPVEMSVGALFLTLAALPLILIGAALALQVGAIGQNLRERLSGGGAGLDVGSLILLFRFAGVALLIVGLLFLAFAWAALKPKRWARTGATVLAVVEILLLVGAMVVTTVDPVSLGIVLLAGAGVVLLYLPRSEEFLLTSR